MLVALRSESVLGVQERAMDLAWNDTTKAKKTTHPFFVALRLRRHEPFSPPT
jgi:hypothetical protein